MSIKKQIDRRIRLVAVTAALLVWSTHSLAYTDEEIVALYKKGTGLINPFLILSDKHTPDPAAPQARAQILEGIRILSTIVEVRPQNWAAFWFIGKGRQALRDHAAAEIAFEHSYAIRPEQPDVARELVAASICAGHTQAAVTVAEKNARLHSGDAGLVANLGLAYLANSQLAEARATTEQALWLDPSDKITKALHAEIRAVQGGRKPSSYCPS